VWPNPGSRVVNLITDLPAGGRGLLAIVDLQGRRVREIRAGEFPAGASALQWDGRTARGDRVAPGAYMARLEWPGGVTQAKFLLVE
jgi:flagellar hook assembly protein FlgD